MKYYFAFIIFFFLNNSFAANYTITIDDPNLNSFAFYSAKKINSDILKHLSKANTQATLFVCGMRVDSAHGHQLLNSWDKNNHLIANHTYSHKYFHNNSMSADELISDILKLKPLIKDFKNYTKLFRFPYLKSGDNVTKRDRIRSFLKQQNYTHGYVTIDASDWYISQRLEERLKHNPEASLKNYKTFYLNHILDRARYYDSLAKKVIGRSPNHTLLLHHNLLTALFLTDLIKHLKDNGWNLIDSSQAFQDPIFKQEPNTIPSGESIVWALAKERGFTNLRYPAEDSRYEKDKMDKLGL